MNIVMRKQDSFTHSWMEAYTANGLDEVEEQDRAAVALLLAGYVEPTGRRKSRRCEVGDIGSISYNTLGDYWNIYLNKYAREDKEHKREIAYD